MYDILSDSDKRNLFEKQLQVFAKDVEILCALESGGKMEAQDAYKQIKTRWKKLKGLKRDLIPNQKQLNGLQSESEDLPEQNAYK